MPSGMERRHTKTAPPSGRVVTCDVQSKPRLPTTGPVLEAVLIGRYCSARHPQAPDPLRSFRLRRLNDPRSRYQRIGHMLDRGRAT